MHYTMHDLLTVYGKAKEILRRDTTTTALLKQKRKNVAHFIKSKMDCPYQTHSLLFYR